MNLKTLFLGALASVGLAGTASAAYVPATWTDTYDVGTGAYVHHSAPYSYWHNIWDDGFEVGSDYVTDFVLTLNFFDDNQKESRWDFELELGAVIDLPGYSDDAFVWDFGSETIAGMSFFGLLELNTIGELSVTIYSLLGDFYLGSSVLQANGYSKVAQVPEPSTLGIFGLGLLGIAFASRRRRQS